jgi:hypothetical protein
MNISVCLILDAYSGKKSSRNDWSHPMTATILFSLMLSLALSMGDTLMRCPIEDIQVIASATALDGEYVQGVLYWPVVTGPGNAMAIALMNQVMSYEAVTGEPLEETLEIFSENERGIVGSMFTVNYLDHSLLDIIITVDFLGAYPSAFEYYFTFNTRTGERLTAEDLFPEDRIEDLIALLDQYLQRNIEIRKQQNTIDVGDDSRATELDQNFVREDLKDFTVMPDGMIFRHDFEFPHALLSLEPEEEIFLEWEILVDFADTEGPWAAVMSAGV